MLLFIKKYYLIYFNKTPGKNINYKNERPNHILYDFI